MSRRALIWGAPPVFYVIFFLWHSDLGGPLSDEDVDRFAVLVAVLVSGTHGPREGASGSTQPDLA